MKVHSSRGAPAGPHPVQSARVRDLSSAQQFTHHSREAEEVGTCQGWDWAGQKPSKIRGVSTAFKWSTLGSGS